MSKNNGKNKNQASNPAKPVPVWIMTVTKYSNGSVNVNNFPQQLQTALHFMFEAIIAVVVHFEGKP